jgi:hypothetical protein
MEAVMHDTIVTVRFTDLAGARRALRMLKLLGSEGQLRVRAAALVERSAQGRICCPSGAEDDDGVFRPQAVVVGIVVDGLSGPMGGVFARPTEGFRRHSAPWTHAGEREVALEEISRNLEPEVTLVIAEIEDPDPDVLDSALDALGGMATRQDAEAFYAELGAAGRR